MPRLTVNPLTAWVAALLVCAACATSISTASAASSKPAEQATKESLQAFERQLAAGEVKSADLRPKHHLLHLKLADGRHLTVEVAKPSARLRSELKAHGVSIAAAKAPPHKLRYIVGGAIVVVLIIAIAGLLIWRRHRRAALDEY